MFRRLLLVDVKARALALLRKHPHTRRALWTEAQLTPNFPIWALQQRPDLIVLGASTEAIELGNALKWHLPTNLLPTLGIAPALKMPQLRVEPDANLESLDSGALTLALQRVLTLQRQRQTEGVQAELCLQLPSDPQQVERLAQLWPDWLLACSFAPFQVQQFNLALREIVNNAAEWAHNFNPLRPVLLHCRLDAEKVSVLVRDTGPGFDPSDLPHAARPGDGLSHLPIRAARSLRHGGYGILRASELVDYLCFSETGNEALLIKYLPTRASQLSVP